MPPLPKYATTACVVVSVGLIACLARTQVAAQDIYLDHLHPIVHFQFNVEYTDTQISLKIGSQQHVVTLDRHPDGRTRVSVKAR